jgi:hypothetical protein
MNKVERRAAIPETGLQIPESEQSLILPDRTGIAQAAEDKRLMEAEIALVRALRYLAAKSESPQP